MSIFTVDPVKKVTKKSAKIVDVFTKTVTNLNKANAEIDNHIESHTAEKQRIEDNLTTLNAVKESNNKVINKVNKIFE